MKLWRQYGRAAICCVVITALVPACTTRQSQVPDNSSKDLVLNVLASASLVQVFTRIAEAFESEFPDISITTTFAGSATLVTQVKNGAPMDIVAFADTTNMDKLSSAGLIDAQSSQVFATNTMTIVVPRANPRKITGLIDLTNTSLDVVLCAPTQPCGIYAQQILKNANLNISAKSLETSVSGVVSKVSSGQADAGIAYTTDAIASIKTVDAVPIPASQNIVAQYPIARGSHLSTGSQQAADAFIAFVVGATGTTILTDFGFVLP